MERIILSGLIFLCCSLSNKTFAQKGSKQGYHRPLRSMMVKNTEQQQLFDAVVIINEDTLKQGQSHEFLIPNKYTGKGNLKVIHSDYPNLAYDSAFIPEMIYMLDQEEEYYVHSGIKLPLKLGHKNLVVHFGDYIQKRPEEAKASVVQFATEHKLVLGKSFQDTLKKYPSNHFHSGCGETNYHFWLQKPDGTDWSETDTTLLKAIRESDLFDGSGLPLSSADYLVNEVTIELRDWDKAFPQHPILLKYGLSLNPRHIYETKHGSFRCLLPENVLLCKDLVFQLMQEEAVKTAYQTAPDLDFNRIHIIPEKIL